MIRLLTRLNCSFLDNFFSSGGDINFSRLWWINEVCFEWLGGQNYGGCRSYMRLRTGCVWFICNTARAWNFIRFLCIFHQRSMTLIGLDFEVRSKRFAFDIRAFMIDYCQKEYLDAAGLLEDWFLELIEGLGWVW